ncbi:uncharacterized protein L201_005328 [Kwoniella dendrophila CBS 6074]|uniref:F-box domain-containing protein n=1 Tax=Kwoniella dendrophila CBS 6074 TaxID=1295534 RepID=A0AAX4K005_9TREE
MIDLGNDLAKTICEEYLSPKDILNCIPLCRGLKGVLEDSPIVQLKLHNYLYQLPEYQSQNTIRRDHCNSFKGFDNNSNNGKRNKQLKIPPKIQLDKLRNKETNLSFMTLTHNRIKIPSNQHIISINNDAFITIPDNQSRWENTSDDENDNDDHDILATVWTINGKPKYSLDGVSQLEHKVIKVRFDIETDLIVADIDQGVIIVAESTINNSIYKIHIFQITEEEEQKIHIDERQFEIDVGPKKDLESIKLLLGQNGNIVVLRRNQVQLYNWIDGTLKRQFIIPGQNDLPDDMAFVGTDILAIRAKCDAEVTLGGKYLNRLERDFLVFYDIVNPVYPHFPSDFPSSTSSSTSPFDPVSAIQPNLILRFPQSGKDVPESMLINLNSTYHNTTKFQSGSFNSDNTGKSDILNFQIIRNTSSLHADRYSTNQFSISLPLFEIRKLIVEVDHNFSKSETITNTNTNADLNDPIYKVDDQITISPTKWLNNTHYSILDEEEEGQGEYQQSSDNQVSYGLRKMTCHWVNILEENTYTDDPLDFVEDDGWSPRTPEERARAEIEIQEKMNESKPSTSIYKIKLKDFNPRLIRFMSSATHKTNMLIMNQDRDESSDIALEEHKMSGGVSPIFHKGQVITPSNERIGYIQYEASFDLPQIKSPHMTYFTGDKLYLKQSNGWIDILDFN